MSKRTKKNKTTVIAKPPETLPFTKISAVYSIAILSILGVILYSNSFNCSFQFDDEVTILYNDSLHDLSDLKSIWDFYFLKSASTRFFGFYSFALNYYFNQTDVFGYHLVNLLIHISAAFFVWWLVHLILSTPVMKSKEISNHKDLLSLGAALVFISHPLQTQAITYIVQRFASLATLCYLASLAFYLKARMTKNFKIAIVFFLLSSAAALSGIFTKEIVITLPFAIILFDISLLHRDGIKNIIKSRKVLYYAIPLSFALIIPAIVISRINIGILFLDIVTQRSLDPVKYITPKFYLLTQFRVIPAYIRLLFLPVGQTIDHDVPLSISLFELKTFLSFILLFSIVMYAISIFHKKRLISLGILWFFLTLSVESSFKPLGNLLFEHRLYLPMFGFSIFFIGTLYYLMWKNYPRAAVVLFTALLITNSVVTYQRNKIWKNPITLWEDAVKKSPNKERTHYNLAFAYSKAGKIEEAKKHLTIAFENFPDKLSVYMNLLNLVAREGNTELAKMSYKEILEEAPNNPIMQTNLGSTYLAQGKHEEAKKRYYKALEIDPNSAEAYTGLGNVFLEEGNSREARKYFSKALEINPTLVEALFKTGDAYLLTENFIQAIASYKKALSVRPNYIEVYNNLGIVYLRMNNTKEAKEQFYQAIRINPDYGMAHYNLANALKNEGKYEEAIDEYLRAKKLIPENYEICNDLGIVYSIIGQLDNAKEQFNDAVKITNNVESQFFLGVTNIKQGKNELAVQHFKEVLKINPNHIDAHELLAEIYTSIGLSAEAEAHKVRAQELRSGTQ
ncbi:tetratricopeptide repeat protein [Candidatus Omnitrophota bacterium]